MQNVQDMKLSAKIIKILITIHLSQYFIRKDF
jgi:hypothetical protein